MEPECDHACSASNDRSGPLVSSAAADAQADAAATTAHIETSAAAVTLGRSSSHAGFVLLVSLLARIGIEELLARNEQLIHLRFVNRALCSAARRLGVGDDDPVHSLLTDRDADDHDSVPLDAFTAPMHWWPPQGASAPCIHRIEDGTARVVVTDSRTRALLAVTAAREVVEHNVRRRPSAGAGLAHAPGIEAAIAATWLMAGSYLRRHAKMSLRSLVRRRARVILTATHWDVMFPLADIDLRVRRLALDTDPGWVPWLGRVVQLHFDD